MNSLFEVILLVRDKRGGELRAVETPQPEAARLQDDVAWLADDAREGRRAGTPHAIEAGEWIAMRMKTLGLEPAGQDGTWFQRFEVPLPAEDGGGWVAPHYACMAASLDVDGAAQFVRQLQALGLAQPLIGLPESVFAGNAGPTPARWHSAQITLNEFFNVVGLYHAIRIKRGGSDVLYRATATQPDMKAALDVIFP